MLGRVIHEVPVVGELQLKTGMIRSFHLENVREEVGSEAHMQGLNNTWALWLATGKIHHSKLLIRFELYEVGTETDPALLALVVINLDGIVVVALECDEASLISPNAILEANQLLDLGVKGHGPELFVGIQHVGLTTD